MRVAIALRQEQVAREVLAEAVKAYNGCVLLRNYRLRKIERTISKERNHCFQLKLEDMVYAVSRKYL